METRKNETDDFYSLYQLHIGILESHDIVEAAEKLKLDLRTLQLLLGKFVIFYDELNELTVEEAAARFPDYYDIIKTSKINLNLFSLRKIHKAILTTENLTQTEKRLGLSRQTINKMLRNSGTSYDVMKKTTKEEAIAHHPNYYNQTIKNAARIDLGKFTLHQFHKAILKTDSHNDVMLKLGIEYLTLAKHLSKLGIVFEELRKLNERQAAAQYPYYDSIVKTSTVYLNCFSLHKIHEIILKNKNITAAAINLGVVHTTLKHYLNAIGTSYKEMKQLTTEAAKAKFPHYEEIGSNHSRKRKNTASTSTKQKKQRKQKKQNEKSISQSDYEKLKKISNLVTDLRSDKECHIAISAEDYVDFKKIPTKLRETMGVILQKKKNHYFVIIDLPRFKAEFAMLTPESTIQHEVAHPLLPDESILDVGEPHDDSETILALYDDWANQQGKAPIADADIQDKSLSCFYDTTYIDQSALPLFLGEEEEKNDDEIDSLINELFSSSQFTDDNARKANQLEKSEEAYHSFLSSTQSPCLYKSMNPENEQSKIQERNTTISYDTYKHR